MPSLEGGLARRKQGLDELLTADCDVASAVCRAGEARTGTAQLLDLLLEHGGGHGQPAANQDIPKLAPSLHLHAPHPDRLEPGGEGSGVGRRRGPMREPAADEPDAHGKQERGRAAARRGPPWAARPSGEPSRHLRSKEAPGLLSGAVEDALDGGSARAIARRAVREGGASGNEQVRCRLG